MSSVAKDDVSSVATEDMLSAAKGHMSSIATEELSVVAKGRHVFCHGFLITCALFWCSGSLSKKKLLSCSVSVVEPLFVGTHFLCSSDV